MFGWIFVHLKDANPSKLWAYASWSSTIAEVKTHWFGKWQLTWFFSEMWQIWGIKVEYERSPTSHPKIVWPYNIPTLSHNYSSTPKLVPFPTLDAQGCDRESL